jgi:hypothetical protein
MEMREQEREGEGDIDELILIDRCAMCEGKHEVTLHDFVMRFHVHDCVYLYNTCGKDMLLTDRLGAKSCAHALACIYGHVHDADNI